VTSARPGERVARALEVRGVVQGVGFRYTVRALVNGYEATGLVRNLEDGRVELFDLVKDIR